MLPTRGIDRASGKGVHRWRLRHGHGHELGCQHKALHTAAFWGSEYKDGGIYLQTFSLSVESYSYIMSSGTPGLGQQVSGSDSLSVYYDVRLASNSIPWLNKARGTASACKRTLVNPSLNVTFGHLFAGHKRGEWGYNSSCKIFEEFSLHRFTLGNTFILGMKLKENSLSLLYGLVSFNKP